MGRFLCGGIQGHINKWAHGELCAEDEAKPMRVLLSAMAGERDTRDGLAGWGVPSGTDLAGESGETRTTQLAGFGP